MKKLAIILSLLPLFSNAQNKLIAIIKNADTEAPLQGASVQIKSLKLSAIANDAGVVIINNLPDGKLNVEITCIGYIDLE